MAPITQYYSITGNVPFVDVDVTADNLLFLDPARMRLAAAAGDTFARPACSALDSFLSSIASGVMSSDRAERDNARKDLKDFREPRETRFGMARVGYAGHGGAEDIGNSIWDALCGDDLRVLLALGILKHLEDLPLFIEGVGPDVTSDITTRIVFSALADFTAHMLDTFPEFTQGGHTTSTREYRVWDAASDSWQMRSVTLPIADGEPLLLVPSRWVGKSILMTSRRFYDTALLTYVQEARATLVDGHLLKTRKADLKRQPGLSRGRQTNIDVTIRAHEDGEDILENFRVFIAEKYKRRQQDSQAA